jgi:hypothetical protein
MWSPRTSPDSAFGASLRAALAANSFSNEAVRAHLHRRGHSVTVHDLEGWLAGSGLPQQPDVVACLEDVLRIVPGSLSALLGPSNPAPPGQASEPGQPRSPLSRSELLRQSFHPDALTWSRTLSSQCDVVLGPGSFVTEVRRRHTEVALVNGVDRYLSVASGEETDNLIGLRTVPLNHCRRGRVRMNPEEHLICTEILLDHSYDAGEVFDLEHVLVLDRPSRDQEYFTSFREAIIVNIIRVLFEKSEPPSRCYMITQRGRGSPPQTREIRQHGTEVHSVVTNFPQGQHGIAWEWDQGKVGQR